MKKLLKTICFCIIFISIFFLLQKVFTPKWGDGETNKYENFYLLEKNSIDILFLGASHQVFSIYPMELYDKQGYRSFNLGSAEQTMIQSYYQLREAIKYQRIKSCFIDVASLFYDEKNATDLTKNQRYKIYPSMKWSLNKLEFILSNSKSNQEIIECVLPLYKFHDRWSDLNVNDWRLKEYYIDDPRLGAVFDVKIVPYLGYSRIASESKIVMTSEYKKHYYSENEMTEDQMQKEIAMVKIIPEAEQYLDAMHQLCEDNNIDLIAVKTPSIVNWNDEKSNLSEALLNLKGIPFVDMTRGEDYVDIDWSLETLDGGGHVNYLGGLKVSSYLGEWISNNLPEIKDRRGEDNAYWNSMKCDYDKMRQEILYMMMPNDERVRAVFTELSKQKEHLLIILTVMNDISTSWNDQMDANMRMIGLRSDYYEKRQDSYIAVIDRGHVVFEEWSKTPLIYRGTFKDDKEHTLNVSSRGYGQGNSCSVLVDSEEYALQVDGLNVVVYDLEKESVTYTFAVNMCIPEHPYVEKEEKVLFPFPAIVK